MGLKEQFADIKGRWTVLASVSTYVLTMLATFISPPPSVDGSSQDFAKNYVRFVLAVLLGLLFIPAKQRAQKNVALKWRLITLGALLLGSACVAIYWQSMADNVASFDTTQIVIGERRSDQEAVQALDACQRTPIADCNTNNGLLQFAQGDPKVFWTRDSIRFNLWKLTGLYMASALLLAFSFVALARAVTFGSQSTESPHPALNDNMH